MKGGNVVDSERESAVAEVPRGRLKVISMAVSPGEDKSHGWWRGGASGWRRGASCLLEVLVVDCQPDEDPSHGGRGSSYLRG